MPTDMNAPARQGSMPSPAAFNTAHFGTEHQRVFERSRGRTTRWLPGRSAIDHRLAATMLSIERWILL